MSSRCSHNTLKNTQHMRKDVTVELKGIQAHGKVGTVAVSWTQVLREYWETRPLLLTVVIMVTLGSPFLWLVLGGWIGVCVGRPSYWRSHVASEFAHCHACPRNYNGQ